MTFNALMTALKATGIPFAEGGWANAPTSGSYGTLSIVSESSSAWASNHSHARAVELACDLFVRGGNGRAELKLVEGVFDALGVPWYLYSTQNERSNAIMHYEWSVCVEVI